jgi:hypothetical protein
MSPTPIDLVLAVVAAVVLTSVVLGAMDVLRQPGWAWRAAGEPKWLSLALVVLLPGVGLAIYVFGARPKVVTVAAAGRAANLPFERFGDRQSLATENAWSIQSLAQPTTLGSFGERRPARTVRASGPEVTPAPASAAFFEDPDLQPAAATAPAVVTAPAAATAPEAAAVTTVAAAAAAEPQPTEPAVPAVAVAGDAEPPSIRFPGSLGRPYHPRQRTSFDEGDSLATVAAQILGATHGPEERPAAVPTAPEPPTPAMSFGAPPAPAGPPALGDPVLVGQVPGPTFAAPTPAHGFGHGAPAPALDRATALQLSAAPVATPGTPEIFRPRPDEVAPIGVGGGTAVAVALAPTLAARWLPDPTGRHQYRYWDGGCWTENVYDAGVESRDPVLD